MSVHAPVAAQASGVARRFRTRLLVVMTLFIAAITFIVLFIAERNAQNSYEDVLQQRFESTIAYELGLDAGRESAVEERCRLLARSVRIRAALQEDDVDDLYDNATAEMPDVFSPSALSGHPTGFRANFIRFLNSQGDVLTRTGGDRQPWEKSLSAFATDIDEQQNGYVAVPIHNGVPSLNEVICTPVIDADSGEKLGAMILGFDPVALEGDRAAGSIAGGILVDGKVYLDPAAGGYDRREVSAAAGPVLKQSREDSGRFAATIHGAPHLVFYRLLNPGSALDKAYQICLFPLADSIASQATLRNRILGTGFVIFLVGLGVSYLLSNRMSRPVEAIEANSAIHQAGREEAEAALELTADELKVLNRELADALEKLQSTQQQVIQQERLRALGEMASGIAHDFNNTLMPITGFSEILIAEPETDEATRLHYLEMINTSARDAGSVVSRLREFYRPNESTDIFGPVLLNRIVKQAANLTQPKWKDQAQANGAQVNVRVHLEDRLPVNGDESALRELLTNLIFNAVDAMPSGGSIQLRTRTDADCGVIEVADTGTGMTEEVRQHCLDPFFSTKGERGTGLGLAMVFGIVQRHQGSIDIVSKVGEGTTFIIRLPLYDEAVALGAGVSSVVSNRSLSVLVVDDEPQVRQVLTAFLHAEGHACETAVHALDGINRFRERHFDIVIADKAMPGMSGDQMAVLLKKLTPSIPVVLLTGFGAFLNGEAMPCVDVIASKPITRAGLRDAMGRALKTA